MNTKDLILFLIEDDLVNAKLIRSFNDIGIDASNYAIKAGDLVFKLMGFDDSQQTEMIRDHYYELSKRTEYIDVVAHSKLFHGVALEIYEYLHAVCPKRIPGVETPSYDNGDGI